jgi:hypothetical protein
MGEKIKCMLGFWRGNLKERDHVEYLGVHASIVSKWMTILQGPKD